MLYLKLISKFLLQGQSLESKFKVTYGIILNKLNSNDINVMDIMKSSFSENSRIMEIPKRKLEIKMKTENLKKIS